MPRIKLKLREGPEAKTKTKPKKTMKYQIVQLTKQGNGTFNESPDMYPDMLNGGDEFESIDALKDWLLDQGYEENDYTKEFKGWGLVLQHSETEELINVLETEE